MMIKKIKKENLSFDRYKEYAISDYEEAYEVLATHCSLKDCEEIEADYENMQYKIYSSQLKRVNEGYYELKLIISKSKPYTF
ncbi:MAG: hypothetical protein QF441_01875 [Bacteriovoracaceae bacterium]|nr:hypothetical protein [Bacteriovoracaceae bacterium]